MLALLQLLPLTAPFKEQQRALMQQHDASLSGAGQLLDRGVTQHEQDGSSRPLYYFTHIPKAAGASFLQDLGGSAINMTLCDGGTKAACFPSMEKASDGIHPVPTLEEALAAKAAEWQQGECQVIGCEGARVDNENIVDLALQAQGAAVPRSSIRELMLLREPVDHVVSMFAMCVANSPSYADDNSDTMANATIEMWLDAYESGDRQTAGRLCYYQPNNLQTASLVKLEESAADSAKLEASVAFVNEEAYFVGVVERYSLSICLFGSMVHGLGALPLGCTCARAEQLAAAGKTVEPIVRDETDETHGTVPVEPSDQARASINRLTSLDAKLYQAAVSRFERDVRASGLGCWLDLAE